MPGAVGQSTSREDPLSLVGQILDDAYRIDAVVGEGGFGVVYKGFHLAFQLPIAVKCLKIPPDIEPSVREAFLHKFKEEGRLLYQLSQGSLGIVRSIALGDVVTPSGIWTPFVVLEWLEGRSLADEIESRAQRGMRGRGLAEVISLLDVPARALAHAHEQRVAHRDIKPANIFIVDPQRSGAAPALKLLDFGIAKVMSEGASPTRANPTQMGFISFTAEYAAPEQFDQSMGPTGPWSDVYAFALVIIEMLTDRPPADRSDPVELVKSALDQKVRPTPRTKGVAVSDAVERVFARALSVKPTDRYTNMGLFWEALLLAVGEAHTVMSTADGARAVKPTPSAQKPPAFAFTTPAQPLTPAIAPLQRPAIPSPPQLQPQPFALQSGAYAQPASMQQPQSFGLPPVQQPLVQPQSAPFQPYYPQAAPIQAPQPSTNWVPIVILIVVIGVLVLGGSMCVCMCLAASAA